MVTIPPELRKLESRIQDRWTVDGVLYEWPHRCRGLHESIALTRIMRALDRWTESRPQPHDQVLIDIGVWLGSDPYTALDPHLCVIPAHLLERTSPDDCWIAGVPRLVVEVLGRGQHPDTAARVRGFLDGGVPAVWVVEPEPGRQRVDVLRRDSQRMVSYTPKDVIECPDLLPGFSVRVADFFR